MVKVVLTFINREKNPISDEGNEFINCNNIEEMDGDIMKGIWMGLCAFRPFGNDMENDDGNTPLDIAKMNVELFQIPNVVKNRVKILLGLLGNRDVPLKQFGTAFSKQDWITVQMLVLAIHNSITKEMLTQHMEAYEKAVDDGEVKENIYKNVCDGMKFLFKILDMFGGGVIEVRSQKL